jgi:hypothetical protein
MKNQSKKLNEAINIIRKHYSAVNVQRTDNEDVVYLFDYSNQKKTIGSEKINKAIEKAVKKQDFPKDVYYADGMLSVVKTQIEQNEVQGQGQGQGQGQHEAEAIETDETIETEEITETEKPKKRGRKKQSDIDAES